MTALLDDRLAALSPAKRKMLFERLVAQAARRDAESGPLPLVRVPREGPLPLSFSQQQVWLAEQLAPGGGAYNILGSVALDGDLSALDVAALAAALASVTARHEVLRTRYEAPDGEPLQVVEEAVAVPLPRVDLSALAAADAEVLRVARAEHARPFDLGRPPMLRALLLRLGERRHVLLLTLHHIAADGWSLGVLTRELADLYAGRALPEPPIQYADFASHQRRRLQGETLEALVEWWRERLSPPPPPLALPFDRPRPAVSSGRGGQRTLELEPARTAPLERLARERGATLFAVLLASFQALLARITGEEDVAVGTPVAGRDRPETEPLIGDFVNVLVLRGALPPTLPFGEAVERARQTSMEAWSHADLPFERLVDALDPARSLAVHPFFQVLFTLQNAPMPRLEIPGLRLSLLELDTGQSAKIDLSVSVAPREEGGVAVTATYRAELFDATTIQRLLGTWATLLAGAAATPERPLADLPLLGDAERQQLLREWNDTAAPAPGRLVHELFLEQADRAPGRPALRSDGTEVSFGDLAARVRGVAAELVRRGLRPEERVGLLLPNGAGLLAAIFGTLAAGGTYVPLDPELPDERLAYVLADSRAVLALTSATGASRLPPGLPVLETDGIAPAGQLPGERPIAEESAAYVLYTSGSTGRPKGVVISHGALAHYLAWVNRELPGGQSPMPWLSSPGFDASLKQSLAPLLRGDPVWHVADLASLPAALAQAGGVTLNGVPSLWRALLEEIETSGAPPRLHLLLGGEALDEALVERTLTALPDAEVWNLYGPTEATANAAYGRVAPGRTGIGRPIANTRIHVLDRLLSLLPLGAAGELCIGGAGLARGYLGRPDLTAERFVPDPFAEEPGARLYRTGDRARHLSDGALQFLGRQDRQVKLRGVRIELEEIERVLEKLPEVRACAVVLREDGPGEARLAAYVVPAREEGTDSAALRRALEESLPAAMVPAVFAFLAELPRTPAGKIDRRALPVPSMERPADRPFEPPRHGTETRLAEVWRQVLGVERVGRHDSFFELGGDSLLAVRVAARARQEGLPLDMARIFQYTSIAALAEVLDQARTTVIMDEPPSAESAADDFPDAELSPHDFENLLARFGAHDSER